MPLQTDAIMSLLHEKSTEMQWVFFFVDIHPLDIVPKHWSKMKLNLQVSHTYNMNNKPEKCYTCCY